MDVLDFTPVVAHDDPDVDQAMGIVAKVLSRPQQLALIRLSIQAALGYSRSGDVSHVTGFAQDLMTAIELGDLRQHAEALADSEADDAMARLAARYGA